ncbi:ABC transporter permease, partial [Mesorhizobium sp. M2A.F.Ca.ET.042.01.1.1]
MSKAMEPDLQSPLGRAGGQMAKKSAKEWSHPSDNWLRGFVLDNRASLGTLAVFIVM